MNGFIEEKSQLNFRVHHRIQVHFSRADSEKIVQARGSQIFDARNEWKGIYLFIFIGLHCKPGRNRADSVRTEVQNKRNPQSFLILLSKFLTKDASFHPHLLVLGAVSLESEAQDPKLPIIVFSKQFRRLLHRDQNAFQTHFQKIWLACVLRESYQRLNSKH